MKSELHSKLQDKAMDYLLAKSYWVRGLEMPTKVGIIDVWGLSRACDFATAAIEVKVSKNDYRSRSQKYKEGNTDMGDIANSCYVLCPAGLIQPEEVRANWGLLWYEEGKKLINKKQPRIVDQTDRQKLETIIYFLSNGANKAKDL
jgi:hypothetical protein